MYVLLSPSSSSNYFQKGADIHSLPGVGCVVFVQVDSPVTLISLWVADVETGKARQLIGPPEFAINTILEQYFTFSFCILL
jgi:hypothetical protein